MGADCSLAICPKGYAWNDLPYAIDQAHAYAECSNRGECDRVTGECQCSEGFTGSACEKMSCAGNCNLVGKCVSMREYAANYRDSFSEKYTYNDVWDADKIYGCICDAGYYNYDCTQRQCPRGDDPLTIGQVNEKQLVMCSAETGTFTLFFNGVPSKAIHAHYTVDEFKDALMFIKAIKNVKISYSIENGNACQNLPNVITVEFTHNFGPLPPLVPLADDEIISQSQLVSVVADGVSEMTDANQMGYLSTKGNKENAVCSNRGLCLPGEGNCVCFNSNGDSYVSSNGYGAVGDRGDCGSLVAAVTTCPGELQCSGHGYCPASRSQFPLTTDDTYRCSCEVGWTGGDCSERLCATGPAWFDYPRGNEEAHLTQVQCSNKGLCDVTTGMCDCESGYFGEACEYMSCPGTTAFPCTGHGQCKSQLEMAPFAKNNGVLTGVTYGTDPNNPLTWDGTRIHSCLCDSGWKGYDCSQKVCLTGDDPGTWNQRPERMVVKCMADGGHFKLKFREAYSPEIPFDATEDVVAMLLDAMATIDQPLVQVVSVNVTNNVTRLELTEPVCSTDGRTFLVVDFIRNHADLPAMDALFLDSLTLTNSESSVRVFADGAVADSTAWPVPLESWNGTTENDVCSNRGLCNEDTGRCLCFPDYHSSDGAGNKGDRMDCGWLPESEIKRKPLLEYPRSSDVVAAQHGHGAEPDHVHWPGQVPHSFT